MFPEPERTRFDLQFRLFGFGVRVHPLFWLAAALLGADFFSVGLGYAAVWVGVVFVSVLVHELGHAVAFRRFGADSHIVLWAFGGLAVPHSGVAGRGRRILVALAGPLAGFLLCGAVYGTHEATGWAARNGPLVALLYISLVAVNLYWGVFNLLPVFPLDGGQVSKELCEARWGGRGLQTALKISIGVAAAVAVYGLVCFAESRSPRGLLDFLPWWFPRGSLWTALLFGLLAAQNYQLLQFHSRGYYYEAPDDRVPWER